MFPYNFRSKQLIQYAKIVLLGGVLAGQPMICQSPLPTPNAPQRATDNRAASPAVQPTQQIGLPMNPDQLAPDAAVITIKGFCPASASKGAAACSTTITKQQFSDMISAMSFNPQLANNPVAVKAFAESYVQALVIADAAERSGLDKDPQFQELMKIIRVRTLADSYRRQLQQKNSNPSNEQIENYYKQNIAKFEQIDLDRVAIPLSNPKLGKEAQSDFRQKAQTLATEARMRLGTGEEPGKVQADLYHALSLTPPLTTDLGTKRRGSLPGALEQELFALKAGDVSKVQTDPSSLTIYKIRTRSTLPLERVRAEIAQEIQQREIQSALQAITGAIKTDFNDQYFKTHTAPPYPSRQQVR
ncbi:MAG TPA: peptidylprolyl isomerase [Candidatus Angelobacter sp.]|nr:peptidylprolyl isomerase [Candidatus Angelobacter sp.]